MPSDRERGRIYRRSFRENISSVRAAIAPARTFFNTCGSIPYYTACVLLALIIYCFPRIGLRLLALLPYLAAVPMVLLFVRQRGGLRWLICSVMVFYVALLLFGIIFPEPFGAGMWMLLAAFNTGDEIRHCRHGMAWCVSGAVLEALTAICFFKLAFAKVAPSSVFLYGSAVLASLLFAAACRAERES